jgi:hypothetical protein
MVDMAITNAIGDDEKHRQPVVDQGDIRRRAVATAAYAGLERFKTSMVAGRARQRLSGAPAQHGRPKDGSDWDNRPI